MRFFGRSFAFWFSRGFCHNQQYSWLDVVYVFSTFSRFLPQPARTGICVCAHTHMLAPLCHLQQLRSTSSGDPAHGVCGGTQHPPQGCGWRLYFFHVLPALFHRAKRGVKIHRCTKDLTGIDRLLFEHLRGLNSERS